MGTIAGTSERKVGRLGAELRSLTDAQRKELPGTVTSGVLVARVVPDSPAVAADLRTGDLLLTVGGRQVTTADEAVKTIQASGAGAATTLRILRDGAPLEKAVTLGTLTVTDWKPLFVDKDNARSMRWLARDHALTVLPAVSSLKALRRVSKPSAAEHPMIGFGNPLLDGDQGHKDFGAYYKKQADLARAHQKCAATDASQTPWQRLAALLGARRSVQPIATRGGLADLAHLKAQTPLPETAKELCDVAANLGVERQHIRLGARATEREIKRSSAATDASRLANYRIVHFATHGTLAGQLSGTTEPGLILTPPDTATEEDDGYLSAGEIAGLKLDADWVILSACNTAGGGGADATGAEALSGLARAFFYAGARALLVSHWEVDSEATVKLITGSVGAIARDQSVGRAEALRRAMLAMIDQGEPKHAHPAYWAPFVVVGEGAAAR